MTAVVSATALASLTMAPAVASAATKATSGAPIIVGGDGDLAVSAGVDKGFEAGIYRFNKAGGLDGRQIKFVGFLDDGFSAATNLTHTQQLVQQDHVMAVVPMLSTSASAATASFLAQNKIPFIGWSINAAFETQVTWGLGINGNQGNPYVQGMGGVIQLAKAMHKSVSQLKMAYIGLDSPGGSISNVALANTAKHLGAKTVYVKAPVPITGTTDYAPYAQAIIASGANAVYEVLSAASSIGLAAALKQAGFKGAIVNGVTYYPGQLAGQASEEGALQGVYVEDEFPADENNTPAVKQALADLKAIGQPPYLVSGVAVGYWAAIVFEQMLKATAAKVGAANVTGATLQKVVTSGWTYKDPIAGGIGTETFPEAEAYPAGCGTLLQTTGSSFKQVVGYQCLGDYNEKTHQEISPLTGKPLH